MPRRACEKTDLWKETSKLKHDRVTELLRCDRRFVRVQSWYEETRCTYGLLKKAHRKREKSTARVRTGSQTGPHAKGRHRSTHRFPGTTLQTIFAHLPRRIRHPSSPEQASVIWSQSSKPANEFPRPACLFGKLERNVVIFCSISARTRTRTHLLYEYLEHRPTIRHVAAKTRAARVRILARGELLSLRKVDAVIAYREPRAVKASRVPATDVHHDAIRVTVRAMHDVVLVKKAQALHVVIIAHQYHVTVHRVDTEGPGCAGCEYCRAFEGHEEGLFLFLLTSSAWRI